MENTTHGGEKQDKQSKSGEVLELQGFFRSRGQEEVADAQPRAPAETGSENEAEEPNEQVSNVRKHAHQGTRAFASHQ